MGAHISRLEEVVVNEWLGRFIVVTGPMRSDKTRETRQLIRKTQDRTAHQMMSFITVKDTRTVQKEDRARGWAYLSSEDDGVGARPVQSQLFDNPEEILQKIALRDAELSQQEPPNNYVQAVDIQELSFLDHRIIGVLRTIPQFLGRPRLLVASGVNRIFRGEAMGVMGWAIANADYVLYRTADCNVIEKGYPCGAPAEFSLRLVHRERVGFDGPELLVRGKEKDGVKIDLRGFTPAPFFDPGYAPEDPHVSEQDANRVYVPACRRHFQVPFEAETIRVHRFALDKIRETSTATQVGSVSVERLKVELRGIAHLDAIIAFLEERGMREQEGVLVPKLYFRGERAGLYVNWEDGLDS